MVDLMSRTRGTARRVGKENERGCLRDLFRERVIEN